MTAYNMKNQFQTRCAPGERKGVRDIQHDHVLLDGHACSEYFDFFPLPLLVLNSYRQIVFSNKAFTDILGVNDLNSFLAKRPGEAFGCIYADTEAHGCGTSEHCRECGALQAIMECVQNKENSVRDCKLLIKCEKGIVNARDLRVFVSTWGNMGGTYYVLTLLDIGHEKRRQVLERIFFHDILNSAGGARNLVEILLDEVSDKAKETVNLVRSSLFALVDEIQKQKQLLSLEKNEYTVSRITLQGLEIVESLAAEYGAHPKALGKSIRIAQDSINVVIYSDFTLLRRVLVNMLINALEATPEGGSVVMGLRLEGDQAKFRVSNKGWMPEAVRLQVFKRSFSTKGDDRGLGTYSIKLLAENYLGGEVGFTSVEPEGTTFWVTLKQCVQAV